jgi:DNA helicase-2/ATP-dependent DNA helicase PcrA
MSASLSQDRLYRVTPWRGGRGAEEAYPSRFLDDIPEEILVGRASARTSLGGSRRKASETLWRDASIPAPAATSIEARYYAGARVKHPIWGEGIVLNSRIQDSDEIVDVVFRRWPEEAGCQPCELAII